MDKNTSENKSSEVTEESKKAKQDLMTKILGWGMIVYFLVLGYSINQSSLFELGDKTEQKNVAIAKKEQAAALKIQSLSQPNANAKAAEIVKAAELELEARKIKDEISDGQSRAIGLIIAATTFLIFYVSLIYKFYRHFEREMQGYVVPKKPALVYAVFIGGSVWTTAVMTAFF